MKMRKWTYDVIRNKSDNPFVKSVLDGHSAVEQVSKMFYFFENRRGFPRNYMDCTKVPELQNYHDEKLSQIIDAFTGLDLRNEQEISTVREDYTKLESMPIIGERVANENAIYRFVRGQINRDEINGLYSKEMGNFLKTRAEYNERMIRGSIWMGAAAYFLACALGPKPISILDHMVYVAIGAATFGVSTLLRVIPYIPVPTSYVALKENAARIDRVVEEYHGKKRRTEIFPIFVILGAISKDRK